MLDLKLGDEIHRCSRCGFRYGFFATLLFMMIRMEILSSHALRPGERISCR
jgi:hypothetical protein